MYFQFFLNSHSLFPELVYETGVVTAAGLATNRAGRVGGPSCDRCAWNWKERSCPFARLNYRKHPGGWKTH